MGVGRFGRGDLVARRGCGVRRVYEVVGVAGGRVMAAPRRVVAVYPGGEERLVLGRRGEVRELGGDWGWERWGRTSDGGNTRWGKTSDGGNTRWGS